MQLITALGPRSAAQLGMILPHEHLFVDLRTPDQPGHGEARAEDVVALMAPELRRAQAAGVTALVDCAPVGVGRRADLVQAVARAAGVPVVVPTGIYREPWVPAWAMAASEDALCDWMLGELRGAIAGSDVMAGFIKLSAGDDGMTPAERRILRAAGRAALAAGAAIGSHTIRGRVVADQLDALAEVGFPAERFIWIHASAEPDLGLNLALGRRGVWVEYDWIGDPATDGLFIERILAMRAAGLFGRLLISHDRGWFDPAQPGGGTPKPFTYISEQFLPKLRAAGLSAGEIDALTAGNPFRAFAREL